MGNKFVSSSPSDNTRRLLDSKLNHYDEENFNKSVRECTYAELSPFHFNANGIRSLSISPVEELTASATRTIKEHKSGIAKCPVSCHLDQRCIEKTQRSLDFFYCLKNCLESAGGVKHLVKEITRSFKAKDYKKTEENAAKFLNSTTPFSKELLENLSDVCVLLHSMLEELKVKLELKHERFKEWRMKWRKIYRYAAVTFSLCSVLLICLAAPHAAMAAIPFALAVSGLCDHVFESWTESFEAAFKNGQEIIAANLDLLAEVNGLQIVWNKVKRLTDSVRKVSGCSAKLWTGDSVRMAAEDIDEALMGLKMSLRDMEFKVNQIIACLEITVDIQKGSRSRTITTVPNTMDIQKDTRYHTTKGFRLRCF